MKGAVYSMVEFNGKLLASINSTVSAPSGLWPHLCPQSAVPLVFSELPVCCNFKGNSVARMELGIWRAGVGLDTRFDSVKPCMYCSECCGN